MRYYDRSLNDNPWIRTHVCGALETAAMMVGFYWHTADAAFAHDSLLPIASAILTYFSEHYPRDSDGRRRIERSQALETWQRTVNPLPDLAGLRFVLDGLLELPDAIVHPLDRQRWQAMRDAIPSLPVVTIAERRRRLADQRAARRDREDLRETSSVSFVVPHDQHVLMPTERVDGERTNWGTPELDAVFPYRQYQVGKPQLEVGRDTYASRHEIVLAQAMRASSDPEYVQSSRFVGLSIDREQTANRPGGLVRCRGNLQNVFARVDAQ